MRNELKQLSPQPGDRRETLSTQRTSMMQSEKLYAVLGEATAELNQGKVWSPPFAGCATPRVDALAACHRPVPLLSKGWNVRPSKLEEALYALEKPRQEATFSPEKLEQVEERLFALKAAGRKYNLPVDELAGLYAEVEEKLALIRSQEHRLVAHRRKMWPKTRDAFVSVAAKLSEQPAKKAALKLEKSIESELAPLKMAGTRFRVAALRDRWMKITGRSGAPTACVFPECATNVGKGDKDMLSLFVTAQQDCIRRRIIALHAWR